jgi:hypothetical protein
METSILTPEQIHKVVDSSLRKMSEEVWEEVKTRPTSRNMTVYLAVEETRTAWSENYSPHQP